MLTNISDEVILKEALKRLKRIVNVESGIEINKGSFNLSFNKSQILDVDFNVNGKCFIPNLKLIQGGHNE